MHFGAVGFLLGEKSSRIYLADGRLKSVFKWFLPNFFASKDGPHLPSVGHDENNKPLNSPQSWGMANCSLFDCWLAQNAQWSEGRPRIRGYFHPKITGAWNSLHLISRLSASFFLHNPAIGPFHFLLYPPAMHSLIHLIFLAHVFFVFCYFCFWPLNEELLTAVGHLRFFLSFPFRQYPQKQMAFTAIGEYFWNKPSPEAKGKAVSYGGTLWGMDLSEDQAWAFFPFPFGDKFTDGSSADLLKHLPQWFPALWWMDSCPLEWQQKIGRIIDWLKKNLEWGKKRSKCVPYSNIDHLF